MQEHGSRYSSLMDLPYFDVVRCTLTDVMHNFYLGTVKAVMVLLTKGFSSKKKGDAVSIPAVLSHTDLLTLQAYVDRCKTPSDIGRLPSKIAQSMANFKAEQWKVWITMFCIPAMRHLADYSVVDPLNPESTTTRRLPIGKKYMELLAVLHKLSLLMGKYSFTEAEVEKVRSL